MKLGVVPKLNSPEALQLASLMLRYAEGRGLKPYLDVRAKELISWERTFTLGKEFVDMVVVIGGDGTVLNTLHLLNDMDTLVATVKYGRRGFLCDVPPYEYTDLIDRIIEKKFVVVNYMRLRMAYPTDKPMPAVLNEFAIVSSGATRAKVIRLYVQKNNEDLYRRLVGDGLIVSTPVGSTAYNLAAGGPILDPEMEAIVVTPLASITVCSRPVVLPADSEVKVVVAKDSPEVLLIADGAYSITLKPKDYVVIKRHPKPAKFARFNIGDYYVKIFERCF